MARRLVLVNDLGYPIGEDHHRSKLTEADVQQILELHEAGLGYGQIAAKFDDLPGGLSKSQVRRICLGLNRAQLPVGTKSLVQSHPWPEIPAGPEDFEWVPLSH